jgi:hypothetical protein
MFIMLENVAKKHVNRIFETNGNHGNDWILHRINQIITTVFFMLNALARIGSYSTWSSVRN